MNKVIDKGFRSCRFVPKIVKHPVVANLNFAATQLSCLSSMVHCRLGS